MVKIHFRDLFREASGNFLTDHLPEDFHFSNIDEFIDEHRWSAMEYWPTIEIEEAIYDCANGFANFLEEQGVTIVREGM